MKMKYFILLSSLIVCLVWVNGALAEVAGYRDYRLNAVTGNGVVGAEYTGTSSSGAAVAGWATATSGNTVGGYFVSNSTTGVGVFAGDTATSGKTYGGIFGCNSTSGIGVYGHATATSGTTYAGYYINASTSGTGDMGWATATSGATYGGRFYSSSPSGIGVLGENLATSGITYGGYFKNNSLNGAGIIGLAQSSIGTSSGVYGQTNSPNGYGVYSQGNMKVVGKFTCTQNVGIGTTTPRGKLDVNGPIYQRGSLLHADYVFENDYKLESIDEHSNFMWKNKHLKAIPKAQKDEDGQEIVEVGAHQKGIVEELEKAHIYIGQLNAKNKEMEDRISKLEALLNNKTQ
jgi:hypothetical protein